MIQKIINKKSLIIFFNVCVIFLTFLIILNYQKYSFLYKHDNCLYWGNEIPFVDKRIVATISYFFINIKIPTLLNLHNQDFKILYGRYFHSIIYILICFLFTKFFFVFRNNNFKIIQQKIEIQE